jgi:hypothetical protein
MIYAATTPQERYNTILADACETQLVLLKHRVGQLEGLPEDEKKLFQDFCDSSLILLQTLLLGGPDIEALEAFTGKYGRKGAGDHGGTGRTAGSANGRFTRR